MKTRVLLAIASGAIIMSAAAPAENYYVRNRPFTQVVAAGGEAMVGAEAFLRALGMNWSVEGGVVTLTDKPASNPTLAAGPLTYKFGSNEVVLEGSPRGGSAYVPLRPLAKLVEYSVNVNRNSGTVDITKARFASDAEKKLVSEVMSAREAEKKAAEEAWAKKAAELKEKREAKEEAAKEEGAKEEGAKEEGKEPAKEEGKEPAKEPGKGKKPKEEPVTPPPVAETKPAETKPEEKAPAKEPRLEVFRADATPDYSTGTVTISCEIKNTGDAPSKGVSGTLILTGPERGESVTDNANSSKKVWYTKSISGPAVVAGGSWQFSEKYRHPSGNSMPAGNIVAEFKLSK